MSKDSRKVKALAALKTSQKTKPISNLCKIETVKLPLKLIIFVSQDEDFKVIVFRTKSV